MIANTDLFG